MRARATYTGHAQNNYLFEPLTDERGVYRYKLVDGWLRSGHRPRWMRTLTHCPRRR